MMIKKSIWQEYKTLVYTDAHNKGVTKYIRQILLDLKGEVDTIIIGDLMPYFQQWIYLQKEN